jgi:lysophospholipase L1-like esterase
MSEVTVFIGDSVTDSHRDVLPPFGDGYVSLIAASNRLPGRIINVGTNGHRLVDLEARWKRDVVDFSPTRVSIAIGINETCRRYDNNDPTSTTDFKKSYIRVIDSLMATGNPAKGKTYQTPIILLVMARLPAQSVAFQMEGLLL